MANALESILFFHMGSLSNTPLLPTNIRKL